MWITMEDSAGRSRSFFVPLKKDEEAKLMKKLDENQNSIVAFNSIMTLIGYVRASN